MAQKTGTLLKLNQHAFEIRGTVDKLTGIENMIAFMMKNRERIIDVFPEAKRIYNCDHCLAAADEMYKIFYNIIADATKASQEREIN